MTKRKCSDLSLSLRDLWDSLDKIINSYTHRIKERFEIMGAAKKSRTAPLVYTRILDEISPKHPEDWRAGDVFFLEQYKNDPEVYQKLLGIRENYFSRKH